MAKERKILPSDTQHSYLREKVLKLASARDVHLNSGEKRLEAIIKKIEEGVELLGEGNLNYQIVQTMSGVLFKKYRINVYPQNGAKIYTFELPKSAKNVKTTYKSEGPGIILNILFDYKGHKIEVNQIYKPNSK